MLVSEIADLLGYEIVGDDCNVCGITWFDFAKKDDIAVIRERDDLYHTEAKVILTKPIIIQTDKTLLITYDDVDYSIVKLCEVLIKRGILHDYRIPIKYTYNDSGFYVGSNCSISENAVIQPGAMIGDDVIISDYCFIDAHVSIGSGTVLGEGVRIGSGSKIGVPSFYHYYIDEQINQFDGCGIVKIGDETVIGCNTLIQRGTISDTVIGKRTMIGNAIDIGHDAKIGDNCKIVSQTGIAGNVQIKDNVTIYGQVGISNNIVVGKNVVVKGRTIVTKSVNDNEIIYGPFGRKYSDEMRLIAKVRRFFERKEE